MSGGSDKPDGDFFACVACGHEHARLPKDGICRSCEKGKVLNVAAATHQEMLDAMERGPGKAKLVRRGVVTLIIALVVFAVVVAAAGGIAYLLFAEPDFTNAIRFRHDGPPEGLDDQRPELSAYTEEVAKQAPTLADCFVPLQKNLRTSYAEALTVGWTIQADGSVHQVTAIFSSMPQSVVSCALGKISAWRFAPITHGDPLQIEVPFAYLKHKKGFDVVHPKTHAVVDLSWPPEPEPED